MKNRILQQMCLLAISMALLTGVLLVFFTYGNFEQNLQTQLQNETDLLAFGLNGVEDSLKTLENAPVVSADLRISYISADGRVLYDNQADASTMENHLERQEVQDALSLGTGRDSRLSQTLGERTYYQAVRLKNGDVLRLSHTVSSIYAELLSLLRLLLPVAIAVLAISYWLSDRMTVSILRPLNELSLENTDSAAPIYDELAPLYSRISMQKHQINLQQDRLLQKQKEFDSISNSMAEGLVLLDKHGYVLSINQSALRMLQLEGKKALGRHALYLNRDPAFKDALYKALAGEHSELILENLRCQLLADPVLEGEKISGAALLLITLTSEKEAELLRREFTANVSHELKTPLTSISGYAELIAGNLAKEEDIPLFAARIYREAGRLISLVQDILKLSQLDEGFTGQAKQQVHLLPLLQGQAARLEQSLRNKDIALDINGADVSIEGYPMLLEELFYNLMDNAIRYNKPGGKVSVRLYQDGMRTTVEVSDTGIGIPKEHHQRIFERFYRVDKSHSRKTGGTGLGLAIVKHIAKLHDADIQLESTPDVGTAIRISFPA